MWEESEKQIIIQNYGKIPLKEIEKLLPNKNRETIFKYAQNHGLKSTLYLEQKKYTIDYNYFDIPNEDNTYWAGFIAADGGLGKDGVLVLGLAGKDREIIETFRQNVNFNGPIEDTIRKSDNGKQSRINIWGVYSWHENLKKYWNITKNKSITLKPPNIDIKSKLALSFICGYTDGDGSIYWSKNKLWISWCGTKKMMIWIGKVLKYHLNIQLNKIGLNGISKVNYHLRLSNNKAKLVINILKDIDRPFYLKRKWDKIYGQT